MCIVLQEGMGGRGEDSRTRFEENYGKDRKRGIPKILMLAKIAPGVDRAQQEIILDRAIRDEEIMEHYDKDTNMTMYTYRTIEMVRMQGSRHQQKLSDSGRVSNDKHDEINKALKELQWDFVTKTNETLAIEDESQIPDKMRNVLTEAMEASKTVYKMAEVIHTKLKANASLSATGSQAKDTLMQNMESCKEDEHVYYKMLNFIKDKDNNPLTIENAKKFLVDGGGRLTALRDQCKVAKVFQ